MATSFWTGKNLSLSLGITLCFGTWLWSKSAAATGLPCHPPAPPSCVNEQTAVPLTRDTVIVRVTSQLGGRAVFNRHQTSPIIPPGATRDYALPGLTPGKTTKLYVALASDDQSTLVEITLEVKGGQIYPVAFTAVEAVAHEGETELPSP